MRLKCPGGRGIPSSNPVLLWKQVLFRFEELSQWLGESSPFGELFSVTRWFTVSPSLPVL